MSEWFDIDYSATPPPPMPYNSPPLLIVMPRGDLRQVAFSVNDGEQAVPAESITEIYFTVKCEFNDPMYLFQKRLSNGDIELIDDGSYQFDIEPSNTDALRFGRYVFDIEIVGPDIKQTFTGNLVLTGEVTHRINEVSNG